MKNEEEKKEWRAQKREEGKKQSSGENEKSTARTTRATY
jgi:hypothetical protein